MQRGLAAGSKAGSKTCVATRCAGVAAALMSVIVTMTACAPSNPGPLNVPPPHGYGGIVVEHSATFTDALEVIRVPGEDPVTITKIELINTSPSLELVDVLIAGEKREVNFQFDDVFPPTAYEMGPLIPAEGAVLLPVSRQPSEMNGYELIFGIKVIGVGKFVRGGYRVEYTANGKSFSYEVTAEITVCTPDAVDKNGECVMTVPDD